MAIYGGLLVFSLYTALPDQPHVSELSDMVNNMFFGSFEFMGKLIDLNRPSNLKLLDMVFRSSGNKDRRDIVRYPAGFINVDEPYDKKEHIARYHFTQCPNADFAKKHGLMHVLPVLCNSDHYGIGLMHGKLIRCGTCGNGDVCDYCVVGDKHPLASQYELVSDENGLLLSRKKA